MTLADHRTVYGLRWARAATKVPFGAPRPRKPAKRLGIKYEKDLALALGPSWVHGAWFEFSDQNGPGYCQPDLYRVYADCVVVLEAKYTWVPEGHPQIEHLYRPILEKVYDRPCVGVVVCKNLVLGALAKHFSTLAEAVFQSAQGPCVLHWRGGQIYRPLSQVSVFPSLPTFPVPDTLRETVESARV